MTQPPPVQPPAPKPASRKSRLIAAAVTVITLVLVFGVVFPQFADYGEAWEAIQGMSAGIILALVVVIAATIVVYPWPYQAALPGIGYWPALVVRQTSFAISNGVPAGGAFGLGVQYEMLADYGFGGGPAGAVIAISSVWNSLTTMALPVVAVLVLAFAGDFEGRLFAVALLGLVIVGVAVGALALVFHSEATARRLGGFADGVVRRIGRLFGKEVDIDLTPKLIEFRGSTIGVVRRRAAAITVTHTVHQLTQFALLYVALRGIQADAAVQTTLAQALVAFSVGRLGSFIPLTPGGLGTIDALIVAILVASGADESEALAATMVWRATAYFPQIIAGVGTFLYWRRRRARRAA